MAVVNAPQQDFDTGRINKKTQLKKAQVKLHHDFPKVVNVDFMMEGQRNWYCGGRRMHGTHKRWRRSIYLYPFHISVSGCKSSHKLHPAEINIHVALFLMYVNFLYFFNCLGQDPRHKEVT